MNQAERDRFDAIVDRVIEELPDHILDVIDQVPIIVLDQPTPEMLRDLGCEPDDDGADICGLHTGTMLTERSVEASGEIPDQVHLFRRGIIDLAGGWDHPDAEEAIAREIRITILHELGHHHGLEEDDLTDLGYD
jgi:predicted Zn-dependent protease with MMP-like domain